MTKQLFTADDNVFDPPQVATLAIQKEKEISDKGKDGGRLYTGLPLVTMNGQPIRFDDYFVMWRRSRVVGILADTSNYKTGFMTFVAREASKHLDAAAGEVGLYCTWEDPVEDFALADIANISNISLASVYNGSITPDERNEILKGSIKRATFPLWLVGHSEYKNARRPRLTMGDIAQALEYIVDVQKRTVKFVMLDYLQRISRDDINTRGDTRAGFVEIMDRVKDMALAFNCGVMIGSQVKREVQERKHRQPLVHDAQETSNFEHTCDGIISMQMPAKYMPISEPFASGINVTNRLLVIQPIKQKKGATGQVFCYDAVYETNSIRRYSGEA
jgi:replicative DNA helicase